MNKKRSKKYKKMRKSREFIKEKIIFSVILSLTICMGSIFISKLNSKSVINLNIESDKDTKDYSNKLKVEENTTNQVSSNNNKTNIYNSSNIMLESNIINNANQYAISMNVVKEILDYRYSGTEKMVFLTFDDGPSPNTAKVLDVLKEKGVHATFFIKGNMLEKEEAAEYLKRVISEGHAIGNHSYSHSLEKLYPNNQLDINVFMQEYEMTNNRMREILGQNFNTNVMRMPGGYMSRVYYKDASLPTFNQELNTNNIVSIDWNALSGDAEGKPYTVNDMINRTIETTQGQNQVIVLMHDTYGKESTAEALPGIIDYYKNNGYAFKVIKST